jgi:hypothetical protein
MTVTMQAKVVVFRMDITPRQALHAYVYNLLRTRH